MAEMRNVLTGKCKTRKSHLTRCNNFYKHTVKFSRVGRYFVTFNT